MRSTASLIIFSACLAPAAFAQFSPGPNPITTPVTGQQTLSSGTGTVDSGGEIRIASGSTVPLLMSGTSSLVNNGSIYTLGTGRAIDSNAGISNLSVMNFGLISSVSSDAFRVNTNSAVSLFNAGTIRVTAGGQAIDWAAISSASNFLENARVGVISAVGEDAVRPGANGRIENSGVITATPVVSGSTASGSDGIDLRTLSGIQVHNLDSGTITGRHGIATDGTNAGPFTFSLNNEGQIQALNGSGVNIDGVAANVTANIVNNRLATIMGGVMGGAVTDGDGDGIDVDGVITLNNLGAIRGNGARGGTNNAEGVAAGGGSITNDRFAVIIGSTLLADAPNGDVTRAGNGILIDDSNGGSAVAATTVNNFGLIQGRNGFGIKIVGDFNDSISNAESGEIRGAGTGATIQMGGGNDTLKNNGRITSDIGNAIDLEAGDDTLSLNGPAARVTGNISGGLGNDTLVINNDPASLHGTVTYDGVLSGFETVDVQRDSLVLSGANTYSGQTIVGDNAVLRLLGANRLSSDSSLLLRGTLELVGAAGANGQTFADLIVDRAAVIDLGSSSITFNSLAGLGSAYLLSVINWSAASSPDYAIRFAGDLSASTQFLALIDRTTVNGYAAKFTFDGAFTNVSAVPLPAGVWLLLSGLAGFGAFRRRLTVKV